MITGNAAQRSDRISPAILHTVDKVILCIKSRKWSGTPRNLRVGPANTPDYTVNGDKMYVFHTEAQRHGEKNILCASVLLCEK